MAVQVEDLGRLNLNLTCRIGYIMMGSELRLRDLTVTLQTIMALSLRLRVSADTNLSVTQGRGSPLAAGAKLHVLSRDPDKSLAFLAVRVQPRWRRPQAGARDDQVDDSSSIHVMSAQARLQGT